MTDFPLASLFPPAHREDWLALVDKVLKGEPYQRLVSRTYDGLAIEPLYERAKNSPAVSGRPAGAPWRIVQRVEHPDPAAANREALEDLAGGATGLSLVFAGSIGAHGFGLEGSEAALARALEGVHLDAGIAVELDLSPQTKGAGARLAALIKKRGLTPGRTEIRVGFDPIGAAAINGGSPLGWRELVPVFNASVGELAGLGFKSALVVADGRVIHNAGGSEAQELAFALAGGVGYLRAMQAGGTALDEARRLIFFRLAADADQFLTMAKFRALRKLWARVEEAAGLAPHPLYLSAETSWRMMTRRDPHVNLLRTTVAVAAAGWGGADAISVLPYTAALGLPDRFARRIARNTQLVLLEESNLAQVSDPAAGSGAIEDLTAKLCAAAWSFFQEIERAGGLFAALEQGLIQKEVARVRAERAQAIAEQRTPITGTTVFANPNQVPVEVLDAKPVALAPLPKAVAFEALAPMRLSEPFE